MDKFDIGEWRNRQIDEEFESSFNINPSLAHKIWEIIQEQMMKVDKEKDNYKGGYKDDGDYAEKWLEVFPTASGFFHFINNKLKKILNENQNSEYIGPNEPIKESDSIPLLKKIMDDVGIKDKLANDIIQLAKRKGRDTYSSPADLVFFILNNESEGYFDLTKNQNDKLSNYK